jgi:hypothetical protein
MGRAPITVGWSESRTGILDQFAGEMLLSGKGTSGASSGRVAWPGSLLPEPTDPPQTECPAEESEQETDVTMQQMWLQLAGPERQRFGQCFSVMVLKSLGFRSCSEDVLS